MTAVLHHHPLRDVVEITPLSEWIRAKLKRSGYCMSGSGGDSSCIKPAGHDGPCFFKKDNYVCVDYIRGRM